MNIPLSFKCQNPNCKEEMTVRLHLDATSFDWNCEYCGNTNYGFFGLEVTVGPLLLQRSFHEYKIEKDFPLSMVFAAMASECELSRLYCEWRQIECEQANEPVDEEQFEEELRNMGNIKVKIEEIGRKLVPCGIDQFCLGSAELKNTIETGFPGLKLGELPESFQRSLFWPRNRILHYGQTQYGEGDASSCLNAARLGLEILRQMDAKKRKEL